MTDDEIKERCSRRVGRVIQGLNAYHDVVEAYPHIIGKDDAADQLGQVLEKMSQIAAAAGIDWDRIISAQRASPISREAKAPRMPRKRESMHLSQGDGLPFVEA